MTLFLLHSPLHTVFDLCIEKRSIRTQTLSSTSLQVRTTSGTWTKIRTWSEHRLATRKAHQSWSRAPGLKVFDILLGSAWLMSGRMWGATSSNRKRQAMPARWGRTWYSHRSDATCDRQHLDRCHLCISSLINPAAALFLLLFCLVSIAVLAPTSSQLISSSPSPRERIIRLLFDRSRLSGKLQALFEPAHRMDWEQI